MPTKNLVPRADGEGKLGIKGDSNLTWKEVNAVSGSFDELSNTQGNNLIAAGSGITITKTSASGSQYTIEASAQAINSINDIADVDTSSIPPTDGQALVWDNAQSQWEPGNVTQFSSWSQDANGSIVPAGNAIYDLGTAELKVRDLYLSDNSLRFGSSSNVTAPFRFGVDVNNEKFRVSSDDGETWSNVALSTDGFATETFVNTQINDALQGLDAKESVAAATTGALSGYTYSNNSFVEDVASGALSVDGYSLSNNSRLLVKDQANAIENGIYSVSNIDGSSSVTLTRVSDLTNADVDADDFDGAFVFVQNGTDHTGKSFVAKPTTSGNTTVGTHEMSWVTFTSSTVSSLNDLSDVTFSAGELTISDLNTLNLTDSGVLSLKNNGVTSELRLYCEVNNAHYTALKSAAHGDYTGNITFTLPPSYGSDGQVLTTNGSGALSWADPNAYEVLTTVDMNWSTVTPSIGVAVTNDDGSAYPLGISYYTTSDRFLLDGITISTDSGVSTQIMTKGKIQTKWTGATNIGDPVYCKTRVTGAQAFTSDYNEAISVRGIVHRLGFVDTIDSVNGHTVVIDIDNEVYPVTNLVNEVKVATTSQFTVSGGSYAHSQDAATVRIIHDVGSTTLTIDDVNLTEGDRILIKDGGSLTFSGTTSADWNGFWYIDDITGTQFLLKRVLDNEINDQRKNLRVGNFAFIKEGTTNAGKGFVCTNATISGNGGSIAFSEFTGAGGIENVEADTAPTLGGTLNLNGQTINGSLIPANTTDNLGASLNRYDNIYADSHYIGQSSYFEADNSPSSGNGGIVFKYSSVITKSPSFKILDGSNNDYIPTLSLQKLYATAGRSNGRIIFYEDNSHPCSLILSKTLTDASNNPTSTRIDFSTLSNSVIATDSATIGLSIVGNESNSRPVVRIADAFNFPTTDGAQNQVLQTNGSGDLSWVNQSSGGIASVSEDSAPVLGGDLNVGSFKIQSTSSSLIIGATASNQTTKINYGTNLADTAILVNNSRYSSNTSDPQINLNGNIDILDRNGAKTAATRLRIASNYESTLHFATNGSSESQGRIYFQHSSAFTGGENILRLATPLTTDDSPTLQIHTNSTSNNINGTLSFTKYSQGSGEIGEINCAIVSAGLSYKEYSKITLRNEGTASGGVDGGISFSVLTNDSMTETLKVYSSGSLDNRVAIVEHDGLTKGLELGGTLVTATAAELNVLDISAQTATDGYYLTFNTSGATWTAPSSGGIGSVAEDSTPDLGGRLNLDNKIITNLGSNGNIPLEPTGTGHVLVGQTGAKSTPPEIRLYDENGTNYTGFKAPAVGKIAANTIYELPSQDGSQGDILETDGAGVLSWVTPSSGGAATIPDVQIVTGATNATFATAGSNGDNERVYLVNNSSTAVSIKMPAVSGNTGKKFQVKRLGTANVTITVQTGEALDTVTDGTFVLSSQFSSVTLVCNASGTLDGWYII